MIISLKKYKIPIAVFTIALCMLYFYSIFHFPGNTETAVMGSTFRGRTLIIDPGHGGADGGADTYPGKTESLINLEIAKKMEAILLLYGIEPVMTRTKEDISYPSNANSIREKKVADTKMRVDLINETKNAVVISIHQNTFTSSQPSGTHVFYADTDKSKEFAEIVADAIVKGTGQAKNRGVTKISGDVYLMNHIDCPAILVECGFLSNPTDNALLHSEKYQLKMAASIVSGYLQSEEIIEYSGGTNES